MYLAMCRERFAEFADLLGRSTTNEINLQNDQGWTALMLAARNSRTDSQDSTVQLLLHAGAKIDLQEPDGWSAIMMAARSSRVDSQDSTIQLLLQAGAKIDLQTPDGWSAIMMAARYSRTDSQDSTIQLLLQAGAKIDLQNQVGCSALMIAAHCSCTDSQDSTVQLLLRAGADAGLQCVGVSALQHMLAVESQHPEKDPSPGLILLVRATLHLPGIIASIQSNATRREIQLLLSQACVLIIQQDAVRLSERAAFDRAVMLIEPITQNLTGGKDTDSLIKQYL